MGPSEKYTRSNKYLTQSLPLTQSPCLGAGADHEVVRLAGPDVLQRQDAPVPVPLALADVLHPLTRLGQGQHLHTNIKSYQVFFYLIRPVSLISPYLFPFQLNMRC